MTKTVHNPALHRFAVLTAISTLLLIALGGLVTSKEVGMSVPDWPTTYGYNMFLFPIKLWKGGIFYEHTHRLFASFVGVLTIALAVWQWISESRRWLKWFGVAAIFVVSMQGALGGLRVVLSKDVIGVFHAAFAQLFLLMLCSIAIFTSKFWMNLDVKQVGDSAKAYWRWIFLSVTVLIFLQLLIAATMRHQHAGLAIPDYPTAYGKLWPATDAHSIELYNQNRLEVVDTNPITASQIILQMVHRLVAYTIFILAAAIAFFSSRSLGGKHPLAKISKGWFALLCVQILLGAATIWSKKAADVATAHVVVGALALATGALLTIVSFRVLMPASFPETSVKKIELDGLAGFPGQTEPAGK